jgi:hypothetical protein
VTNNEQAAAHRILQKHGIEHKLHGHFLPLASNDFEVSIDGELFYDFDDIRKYVRRIANNYGDASVDLTSWKIAEDLAEVARINARCR